MKRKVSKFYDYTVRVNYLKAYIDEYYSFRTEEPKNSKTSGY